MPKKTNALIGMHPEAVKTLEKLGHRLRANRIAQGWTVQQMADRLFCSPNTYRAMEAGKPSSSVGIIVSEGSRSASATYKFPPQAWLGFC